MESTLVTEDREKTVLLNVFFASLHFTNNIRPQESLSEKTGVYECQEDRLSMKEDCVREYLNKFHIYKSTGHDGTHP